MLLAATAGFRAYLLPVALDPAARHYEAAFLSFVRGNAFNVAVFDVASRARQSPALRSGFTLERSDDVRRDPPSIEPARLRDDRN